MTTTELLLTAWRFDPLVVLGCATALGAYASIPSGRRTTSRAGYLTAAFVVLVVALASPVGALADGYLFSAHMLQHLLLLLVVPPLALMGLNREIGRSGASPDLPVQNPRLAFVAWLAGVSAMWLWHAPQLCNAATRSSAVHLVQEVSLLVMGTWFFWPILAPKSEARLPPFAAIAYLFTACTACTILGIAVTFSPVEICTSYLFPSDRLGAMSLLYGWGLTPQRDQQIGGLLMWLPACLVYGAGILGILARWYREPEDLAAERAP